MADCTPQSLGMSAKADSGSQTSAAIQWYRARRVDACLMPCTRCVVTDHIGAGGPRYEMLVIPSLLDIRDRIRCGLVTIRHR
ncbi:hypothetical protein BDZ97DRAFT_1783222 [Flammula alnicola]|nr:hypothetical protein BDZ97DRAFT_1783222 [Flammula alnicola]